ncbi:MaoC/PaaZ C-terminal domain-containing protein [Sphingobium estronivorans]|uniref:MaoC/PaaZ C-terminal domain-containing protein n=1 Tax=Sphingobium estronivorans TaxID=1577690 RepID=UPI001239174C
MTYAVGDELPPFIIDHVDPEAMKEWAIFLADPNQIHLDVEFVKAKGLGDRVINQGPINIAYMMNCLLSAFPGGQIANMTSRFLDNVYGGERIVAKATVDAIEGGKVTCSVRLDSEDRGMVNSATATIVLPPSQSSATSAEQVGNQTPNNPLSWLTWLLYPKA